MNLEQLKEVDLNTLEQTNIEGHVEAVLGLEKKDQQEYLEFAIDTYYKSEDEGENSETIETFFGMEKFKPIYEELMVTDSEEEDSTDDSTDE